MSRGLLLGAAVEPLITMIVAHANAALRYARHFRSGAIGDAATEGRQAYAGQLCRLPQGANAYRRVALRAMLKGH